MITIRITVAGTIHRLDAHPTARALADAVEAFPVEVDNPNRARAYGIALHALVALSAGPAEAASTKRR